MAPLLQYFVLMAIIVSIEGRKDVFKCSVCGKNLSNLKAERRKFRAVSDDLFACFGPLEGESPHEPGKKFLCGTRRRALADFKRTGKRFFHLAGKSLYVPRAKGRPQKSATSRRQQAAQGRSSSSQTQEIAHAQSQAESFPRTAIIDLSTWSVQNTCFGEILRGPCGTLLPPGLLEEVAHNFKQLSQRCDLKEELQRLKEKMYHEFTISSQAPIYDPEEFKAFCISAGATTIFDIVLAAMTSERHSEDRIKTNQQRTVAILYTLCFGLSQVCNWLQTDNAIFLHQSNLNQHGLDTVRQMGGSCCRRLAGNLLNHFSNSNHQKISELINDAIQHQWQLVLVIDDFTSIHTRCRPTTDKLSQSKSMCTIIIKVLKNIKAIPACLPSTYHCLQAIDIDACIKTVSGASTMHKLTFTYSSIMPSWIRASFFNEELERHRLATHEYCERETVQSMRQMKDVNLVDFVQLTLKSKNDFEAAFDIVLSTKLAYYLKLYLLPQPGDWPAQFYSRQIVYETLLKFSQPVPTCLSSSATNSCNEHTYAVPHCSVPTRQQCTINTSVSPNQPAILSVIPCIGPLHVS
ncbi:unnamed protein product [Porites lobata]|uniref:Uncharacterized protein n=1 Tax=Porites lobata TaxID=104759 RepID=A0ABN8RTA7_9CNID|nr:unnamed protein product [Porites lobata]